MQKSIKKNVKGITLVALVVTIVVLLILAGVSLNLVLGNNGIINKAKEAKDKTEQAKTNEEMDLGKLEDWMLEELGEIPNSMTLVEAFNNGLLKVGDYMDYKNPTSGTYLSPAAKTGVDSSVGDQTYTTSNDGTEVNWRILGLSEDGNNLLLTTGSPLKKESTDGNPYYFLKGATGYKNFIGELNNICGIYKNEYADSSKSLTIDDINRLCGVTADITNGKVYKTDDASKNNIDRCGTIGTTQSFTNQFANVDDFLADPQVRSNFEKTDDAYWYRGSDVLDRSLELYDILFVNNMWLYWLASGAVRTCGDRCEYVPGLIWGVDDVLFGGLIVDPDGTFLFDSNGEEYNLGAAVRPIVTLKSDVKYGEIQKNSGYVNNFVEF